ncbi:hypothetical protein HanRHA438_Chr08g0340961 [Helianthus annuus]|nr:hypothetical protein HanIR_Chr08g0356111 [Helianthus annuus]KAJ0897013.1 hypothetical protein HanRHA438_Chr08g0340961 [Helianthus annuus]
MVSCHFPPPYTRRRARDEGGGASGVYEGARDFPLGQGRETPTSFRVPPQTQRRWLLWLKLQALVLAREEYLILFQHNSVILNRFR